jgi:hypothetical protein
MSLLLHYFNSRDSQSWSKFDNSFVVFFKFKKNQAKLKI